jgi:hypothetical protein
MTETFRAFAPRDAETWTARCPPPPLVAMSSTGAATVRTQISPK